MAAASDSREADRGVTVAEKYDRPSPSRTSGDSLAGCGGATPSTRARSAAAITAVKDVLRPATAALGLYGQRLASETLGRQR